MKHLVLSLSLFASVGVALADDKSAWSDPVKASAENLDFNVQGEYLGQVGKEPTGMQVIAEGGGKFAVVLYPGGLPGKGWSGDKATRVKGRAATADGATSVEVAGKKATIKDGKVRFADGVLERVERKSPTLGATPPTGAKVLFDGKSADHWQNGRLDGETLMQGVTSKDTFQSYSLHVEFRIPYQPAARGQGRGNSGCYQQGRYEVQMLDSFGLEGENNECGGVYTIAAPKVNMAFPPLTWQTYDIDYTAAKFENGKKVTSARMTVKHNGVLIHEDLELPHGTTAAPVPEGPTSGPIHLQDHGNPVRYRNIWLVEKK